MSSTSLEPERISVDKKSECIYRCLEFITILQSYNNQHEHEDIIFIFGMPWERQKRFGMGER